jgi:dynein light intermediate chain
MISNTNIESTQSLIKYENPQLIRTFTNQKQKNNSISSDNDEDLNAFLPPRQFSSQGELWTQEVSATPSTRIDVVNLQSSLEVKLQQQSARKDGICPIREDLYSQCFDEIIRQISIQCRKRGHLLAMARDELKLTKMSYQSLYESTIAYGMRKELQAEHEIAQSKKNVDASEIECSSLETKVKDLEKEIENIEFERKRRKEEKIRQHKDEIENLKKSIESIKIELEEYVSSSKMQ